MSLAICGGEESKSNNTGYLYRYLLIVLAALVIIDGVITKFLIENNLASESNPFIRAWAGSNLLILAKMVGALLCTALLWNLFKRAPRIVTAITMVLAFFYLAIVSWNMYVLFSAL